MGQPAVPRQYQIEQLDILCGDLASGDARWINGASEFATPIAGLTFYRRAAPTQPTSCMVGASVALVVQGAKPDGLMDSVDLQALAAARRWGGERRRFALVTVARTWGGGAATARRLAGVARRWVRAGLGLRRLHRG